ncbi:DUF6950 family protein [Sphingomonas nostoxanthinifaciens]|uniref:DUF6950 family protein n=1 Tax=Sphingomonas nostoxanthinifaciens TaxID=2872652 RepID=UPI001CC1EB17|nr:hypothetical protein [Sphingomonas nostoxanthinifaciens]UAK24178.1 hypothetical protein K8P63_17905 [Sphingomonas nostoxanthinifaciens]
MIARPPTPLEIRVAAAQQLLDAWKGRPFDWKAKSHCARMVAEHLRRMGYTPPLAKAGPFSTEMGALRALRRLGVHKLGDAVDLLGVPRIAPAAALPGDIVELTSASPLGCLTVALSNGRVLGFVDDHEGVAVLEPLQFEAAWRIDPR